MLRMKWMSSASRWFIWGFATWQWCWRRVKSKCIHWFHSKWCWCAQVSHRVEWYLICPHIESRARMNEYGKKERAFEASSWQLVSIFRCIIHLVHHLWSVKCQIAGYYSLLFSELRATNSDSRAHSWLNRCERSGGGGTHTHSVGNALCSCRLIIKSYRSLDNNDTSKGFIIACLCHARASVCHSIRFECTRSTADASQYKWSGRNVCVHLNRNACLSLDFTGNFQAFLKKYQNVSTNGLPVFFCCCCHPSLFIINFSNGCWK